MAAAEAQLTGSLPRITAGPMSVRVTALEVQLPRVNAGLQTTLRQNNLVLESEMGALTDLIGVTAAQPTAAAGQTAASRR